MTISITRQRQRAFAALAVILAAAIIALLGVLIAGQANASPASAGPVLGTGNAYYTSPVNLCTELGDSDRGYVEQHSLVQSNCAPGYAQFTTNTPYLNSTFTFTLPAATAGGPPGVPGDTSSVTYSCAITTSGLTIESVDCAPSG